MISKIVFNLFIFREKVLISDLNQTLFFFFFFFKSHYFHSQFERFKLDAKKTWNQIKGILNKQKSNSLPLDFLIDGNQVSDKKIIADKFNIYFNNIGPDLASKINTFGKKSFKSYLTNTPTAKFELHLVTEQEIINIIQNMQPKNTFGYDEISNKIRPKSDSAVEMSMYVRWTCINVKRKDVHA